jgi:FkbM family methyltransferase
MFGCMAVYAADPAKDSPEGVSTTAEKPGLDEFVDNVIDGVRDDYDAIPGKTGILAEERLYSIGPEELIIRDFFQDRRDGFYVDVGCAWAEDKSNTYYLEKHLGWTGIGIDALDDYADEWASKRPKSKFRNYLITSESGGEGTIFKSVRPGLSSTNEKMASGGLFGYDEAVEEISVPMITLTDLLDEEGVTKVDLLSMDIEGHEPAAFAGFDIDRFQPELLVIEGKSKAVEVYLKKHGYEQIERYADLDPLNRYFQRKGGEAPSE